MCDFITRIAQAAVQALAIKLMAWGFVRLGGWLEGHAMQSTDYFSVGQAAKQLGLKPIQVSRLYEQGYLPPAPRCGRIRMVCKTDLRKLKDAAKKAGYLK